MRKHPCVRRHALYIDVCFRPAPRWIQVGFFLQGINSALRIHPHNGAQIVWCLERNVNFFLAMPNVTLL
ncbi:hypothetical protein [Steroidobacter agaridevorans]|uniref:hypothetical protein n=1 Tax=Steroidobacter agaridevorans TaxID=2695856 RepID=UPI001AD933E5|nr:hypothetical protein [Steroidobacter agaridevorans]